jgi:2-oxo-4-hydroxy-4-carboxy--5-ureidoimidazoline (OHCU) decarboxylase
MHDLPRQLSADDLGRLFESSPVVERLAAIEDPLGRAREEIAALPEDEQAALLAAHPRIGATVGLSTASTREQGAEDDPAALAELAELNEAYEAKFGFRFVVFVNGRPRSAIVPVLRERLERTREEELRTGLDELVAIAIDRWRRDAP